MEAEVVKKDGVLLVREMAAEVKNMLDFKMNAVMVRKWNYRIARNEIHPSCIMVLINMAQL